MRTARHDSSPEDPQAGGVMLIALFLVIFTVGIVATGSISMKTSRTKTDVTYMLDGQAATFARSGLTEATNWFRRQTSQPVTSFAPVLDNGAKPPVLDTEDPDIGLVREFRIIGNVYGRYEVWKQWDTDPDPKRLARRKQLQVEDISHRRNRGSLGTTWLLKCVGSVYMRRDPTKSFEQAPNYTIATETLQSEISRMAFALPGQAALSIRNASDIDLQSKARIDGGTDGVGLYYPSGTGTPTVDADATLRGVAPLAPTTVYDDSIKFVFDTTDAELTSLADLHYKDDKNFPARVPSGSLVVLDAASGVTFTKDRPLSGDGIVVIRGDAKVAPGSSSSFFGLLYVDGDLSVASPALIQGAVVVTQKFTASGTGDYTDIIYDDDVIKKLQTTMATYRVSRAPRRMQRD